MKLLMGMFFCLCMCIETSSLAAPLDKEIQVDVLISKITSLLQSNMVDEAIPYMRQLNDLGAFPQRLFFQYIEVLDKTGNKEDALDKAEGYLKFYGKDGEYYENVLAIMGRLSIEADKAAKDRVAAAEAALKDFEDCARNAVDLQGEKREVKRRKGLYSTGFSSISYDSIRQDIKGLNRNIDKFNKNCMHAFSVPRETIKSTCSHPAYQSDWCDGF